MDNGDGRLIYGNTSAPTNEPKVRTWDESGSSWSAPVNTIAANDTTYWVVSEARPTDPAEEIVGVLSRVSTTGTDLDILRLDDGTWSVEWSSTAITNANSDKRGYDIAHEAVDGRTLVVYSNNTANPLYRVWDGTSWTAPANVFGAAPGTGVVVWMELQSRPFTNEVALVYADTNDDLFAVIWDGTAWDPASPQTLETALMDNPATLAQHNRAFDLAYEEQTGDLMVAWGRQAANGFYWSVKTADTNTWSAAAQVATAPANGTPNHIDLAGEPGGNRIAGGFYDLGNGIERLGLATWDGAAWVNPGEYDSQIRDGNDTTTGDMPGAVGWIGSAAVAVYADDATATFDWAQWTSGGGWVIQADVAMAGKGLTESVALEAIPETGEIMVVLSDDNADLYSLTYDGTTWTVENSGSALETSLSTTWGTPFGLEFRGQSFTDETTAAGLSGVTGNYAVSWGDYDNDGYTDLWVGGGDLLFLNDGDGTFSAGPVLTGGARGGHWGDYDNDGFLDFFSTLDPQLHLNNGNGTFTLQNNTTVGLTGTTNLGDVSWIDQNEDGLLDLWAPDAAGNFVFQNDGDGTFTSQGVDALGLTPSSNGETTIVADYDGDGHTDILYRSTTVEIWNSDGDGTYTNVTGTAGVSLAGTGGGFNGTAFGDYDNDGDLDLFGAQGGSNKLYSNDGDGTFTDVTGTALVAGPGGATSRGVSWGDYDNDGDLDVFVAHSDAANNLYRNNGDGTFTDRAAVFGLDDAGTSYGATWADIDIDGDLDLVVGGDTGTTKLWINQLSGDNFLKVRVTGAGSGFSAVDGTGSRVELWDNAGVTLLAVREITGGVGMGSHDPRIAHFGLADGWGGGAGPYQVRVEFPSGQVVTRTGVVPTSESTTIGATPVPQTLHVSEPSTIALTSGDLQAGVFSTVLASPFLVTVTDGGGSPVPGVEVTFAIASTPTGAIGQSLSATTVTTNGSGQASSTLTLGDQVGIYTATASVSGLSGSPVTFSSVATDAAATPMVLDHVETNEVTLSAASTDVTVSAVVPERSILYFTSRYAGNESQQGAVRGYLLDSTTIRFEKTVAAGAVTVRWHLVEFTSGVTVQRGLATESGAVTNVPIPAMDLARSTVLISRDRPGTAFEDDDFTRARLTSSTNFEFAVDNAEGGVLAWQVAQINGTSVERNTVTLGSGATTTGPIAISAVDTTRAVLSYSWWAPRGTLENIGQKMVQGRILSGSQIEFTRDNTGVGLEIAWEVIEYPVGVEVQHYTEAFANPDATIDVSIDYATPSKAVTFSGGQSLMGQSLGKTNYLTDDVIGMASFTQEFVDETTLRLTRAATGAPADVGWFTLQFEPSPRLAITAVNSGSNPVAGATFDVDIESRDKDGNPTNVSVDTDVVLSLDTGGGTLGGTLTGTILAGTSTVTISGVTYTMAEAGVVLTATRTAGDPFGPGDSSPFTVDPGPFTKLQILVPGETADPGSPTGKTGTPTAQTAGSSFSVTVNAVDANWNLVNTITDVVGITSTDSNATLPANAPLVAGTRNFTVTLNAAGSWTVTASDITDPTKTANTSPAITTNAGAFSKLQILVPGETADPGSATGKTGTPSAQTAGSSFSVTVNAVDANWNLINTITDVVGITSTDSNATLPANAALVAGTRNFSVTLNTGGSWTVTASDITDPTKTADTSPAITTNAGAFSKLQILVPGETAAPGTPTGKTGTPSAQTAGVSFSATVNAVDANWNVVNTITDVVGITSTDTNATLPANAALVAGTGNFTVTLNTVGSWTVTASDITDPTKTANTSPAITTNAGGFSKLQILVPGESADPGSATGKTGTPSAQTAGSSFSVTVNAVDANWNLINTITDVVGITSSDTHATLPANAALVAGTGNFTVTLNTAGTPTVTASDITDPTKTANTSPPITTNPGPFTKLQILVPGESADPGSATGKTGTPSAQTAGSSFSATVNAVDALWNVVGTVTDVVAITSTDTNATLPANAALVAGTRNFTVTLNTVGSWTVTASDITDPTKTANTSPAITTNAGAFSKLQILVPGESADPGTPTGKTGTPSAQTAGSSFSVTVNAVDANWNLINTITDVVGITSTETNATLPANAALVAGTRNFTVTLNAAGSWTVTASDITDPTKTANTSPAITTNAGPFSKLQILVPGETADPGSATGKSGTPSAQTAGSSFSVTVNAVDANWNLINTITDVVGITSSDTLANLPANAALVAGTRNFTVTLNTAGTPTVTASDITDPTKTADTSPPITTNPGPFTKLQILVPGESADPGSATGKTGTPSAQTTGSSFSVTVNAVDALWNVVGTVTDVVAITSTDSNATLPANAALVAGTRNFAVTLNTVGSWTVTASDVTDPTKTANTSPAITTNVGAFSKLQILVPGETADPGSPTGKTGTPSAQTAGSSFSVTVNAVDANWNLINTITDVVGITSTDSNATLPANAALVAGTRNFTVTLNAAGSWTVTASDITDPTKTADTSPAITTNAGPFTKLQILVPGETADPGSATGKTGTPSAQTAGSSFSATVNAVDALWNVVGTVTDVVGITSTDSNATLPVNAALVAGTGNFTVTLNTAGSWTVTASDITDPTKTANTSPAITTNAGAFTKLQILVPGETAAPGTPTGKTGTPSAQTAGSSFSATVNAVDANWNVVNTITDVVGITSTDTNATLPANAALVAGTRNFSISLNTVGSWTVTASDITDPTKTANTSPAITTNVGAFAKLQILVPGETADPGSPTGKTGTPSAQTVANSFSVTVNAVDSTWNLINTVTDVVGITSSDTHATLPANAALVAGTQSFTVTLNTAGTPTVTASDITDPTKTADTSPPITTNPGPFTKLQILVPGETADPGSATGKTGTPSAQTAGSSFSATVNAVDALWNVVGTITDVVGITSTDTNATLPANAALVAGTRDFTVTLNTAGSWTVTASDITDPTKTANTSPSITTNAGAFTKLQILVPGETAAPGTVSGKTGTPSAQTSGSSFSVTVNAVDANWNVVGTVTDVAGITSTDTNATLPANAALVAGTRNFTVTLNTVGSWTVTASDITDPTKTANTSPAITTNAGAFSKLQILVPGETADPGSATGKTGTPSAQTAGSSFSVTVNAVDANWNLINTITDVVGITSSDTHATLPANAALVAGTQSFTVTLNTAGTPTVTASDITDPTKTANTSPPITTNAGSFTKLQILVPGETADPGSATGKTGTPSAQTAGSSFSATVNAVDALWNVVGTITDVVGITSTDTGATLPANAALVAGTGDFTVTLNTVGSWTVTASDITDPTKTANTSPAITTNAGAFSKLQILVPGETADPGSPTGKTGTPSAQTAGSSFSVTVNAVDANWNLINTVTDVVGITSTDTNATLPANAALVAGTRNFTVTLNAAGSWTVTASDITDPTKTANTSPAITTNAGAFSKLQILVPGETADPGSATGKTGTPSAQTAGSSFSVTVNAVDANWNLINTITDVVGITSSDTHATLPANAALVAGTRNFTVTLNTAGTPTVTASDITDPTKTANTSPPITTNPGPFTKLQVLVPGETADPGSATGKTGTPSAQTAGSSFSATVNAVDALWNVVGTVTDVVGITSTDSNATLPANAALVAGTRDFTVTLNTAGSWTVTASDITDPTKTANTSPAITTNAGAFSKLQILVPGETADPGSATGKTGTPSAQTAGSSFSATVNAVDANWNLINTVTDVVGITSTDSNATLPANAALVAGTGNFTVTLNTAGSWTVTASDVTDPTKTANTSPAITTNAGAFTKLQILVPGETADPGSATGKTGTPSAQTAGSSFSATVNAVDANWNLINTVTDVVGITSTDSNATLPANAALVAGTRDFTVTLNTAGSWTVTASDITDPTKTADTSPSITTNAGAFTKLQILVPGESADPGTASGKTGTPSAQTAGSSFSVTINAVDALWNVVGTVTDVVGVTSTDSNATLPANAALVAGTRNFTATLNTAGSWTLTASDITDPTKTANTSPAITTNAGAFSKLQILVPGETADPGSATGKTGTPSAQTAGSSFSVTVNAVDANWNLINTITDVVGITSSDTHATLPANAALVAGTRNFTLTLNTAGTPTVTASDITDPTKTANTSPPITTNPGPFTKLQILVPGETADPGSATGKTGTPSAQTAGSSFSATVNAVDALWNVVGTVTDVVGITSTDSNATLPANASLVAGTMNFTVTLNTAGSWTVTASDISDPTKTANTSPSITTNAGAFTKLQILVPGESADPGTASGKTGTPSAQTAGSSFSVTVNAVDALWNVVGTITDVVGITSTDSNATLPANAALVAGTRNFTVTLNTAGSWTVTASDITDPTKTANTSPSITANPGAFSKLQILVPGETADPGSPSGKTGTPTAQTAGSSFSVTVNAVDASWNLINTITDVVGITSTDTNATLPANAALVAGTRDFTVTLNAAGTWTVTASDITDPTKTADTSPSITTNAGAFTKLQILVPGETADPGSATGKTGTPSAQSAGASFSATVNAVDALWNVVGTVTDVVGITSTDSNATLPANAALVAGTRSFTITLNTAGTWTVTASDITDPTKTANTSPSITTNPGAFTKLQILVPGETADPGSATGKTGTPSAQTAGASFSATVNAVDANWNLISTVTDVVAITSTDSNATLPANAALVAGTGDFTVTLNTAGSWTVTASDITDPTKTADTSPSITTNAGAFTKLQILVPGETADPGSATGKTGTPSAQTAGASFSATVNAVDANWNLISTVTDVVAITSTDSNATLPANAALVAGTRDFTVTLNTAGSWTLTASDTTDPTKTADTSPSITTNAGAFTKLQILVPGESAAPGTASGKTGSPSAQTAGGSFSATVNAVDALWNIVGTVTDVVGITSTDSNATLPANAALVAGTRNFTVTLNTAGSWTVTASDITDPTKTANTSPSITTNPGAFAKLQILVPGETADPGSATGKTGTPTAQTAGVSFSAEVNAVDANWNLINTITDVVAITSTDTYATLPADAALVAGTQSFTVTLNTAGSSTVTASDVTDPTKTADTSPSITTDPGAFTQLQILVPGESADPGSPTGKTGSPTAQTAGTPFSATVNAVDANWNVVGTITDVVAITSTDVNATLPADAALVAGTQSFSIVLRTAGAWTITASDVTDPTKTANTSSSIATNPGAFAKLQILVPGETADPGAASGKTGAPVSQTISVPFSVTVNAVDDDWNLVATVSDVVGISSSDGSATLPPNAALVAGTNSFSVTLNAAGSWTVTASDITDPTKTADTSSAITANPGVFAKLQVLVPGESAAPGTATGKTGTPLAQTVGVPFTITVNAVDSNWNPIVAATDVVTLSSDDSYADLPADGALVGGTQDFVVTMKAAGDREVTATNVTDPTITPNTSSEIPVGVGPFTMMQILVPGESADPGSPSGKTGTPLTQTAGDPLTVRVNAVDDFWNIVTTVTDTVGISSSDLGADLESDEPLLSGTQFFDVTLSTAGDQTLTATNMTDPGTTPNTSPPIPVVAGSFSKLQILVPGEIAAPGTATGKTGSPETQESGVPFAFTVNAVDSRWNLVNTVTDVIQLSSSDGAASLPEDFPLMGGTASSTATLVTAGSQTLTATDVTDPGKGADTSSDILVSGGGLDHFEIAAISSPQVAGTPFTIVITAKDAGGTTVTSFEGTVSLSTTAGSITPEVSATFVGGVLTETVTVTRAGSDFTIAVDDGAGHTGTSSLFDVLAGSFTQLQVLVPGETPDPGSVLGKTGSPDNQILGEAFEVRVRGVDDFWNLVATAADSVSLTATDSLAVVSSPSDLVGGERSMSVTLNQKGTFTVLSTNMSDPAMDDATSAPINVFVPAFTKLQILVPGETAAPGTTTGKTGTPVAQTAGTPFSVIVNAVDDDWNPVDSDDIIVITSSDAAALLPSPGELVGGSASFEVTLKTADDQTLTATDATSGGIDSDTSAEIEVVPGALDHFDVAEIGSPQTLGVPFNISITARDACGNTVTGFEETVALSTTAGIIDPDVSGVFVDGVYTTSVSVSELGLEQTITVVDDEGHTGVSNPFDVIAAPDVELVFLTQPGDGFGGTPLPVQPVVEMRTLTGERVTYWNSSAEISISSNPAGGTLSGTTKVTAVLGVATFEDLSIDEVGEDYELEVVSGGLSTGPSAPFDILTGPAARLSIVSGDGQRGALDAELAEPLVVRVTDAGGNPVPGWTIEFAIVDTPFGATGQRLDATTLVTDALGQASVLMTVGDADGEYRIDASAAGVSEGSPANFTVLGGLAPDDELRFAIQPGTSVAGDPLVPQPVLHVVDASGQLVPFFNGPIELTLDGNDEASLGGTSEATAAGGVAVFTDLTVDRVGNGYRLVAAAEGLEDAVCDPFIITVGEPQALVAVSGGGQVGQTLETLSDPFVIEVQDKNGNPVPGVGVWFEIGVHPGGAEDMWLSPATALTDSLGRAETSLTLGSRAGTYGVTASIREVEEDVTILARALSGVADHLAFFGQPGGATGGRPFGGPARVEVRDAEGNRVTHEKFEIVVQLGENPAGGILGGTRTLTTEGGIASFEDLIIDRAGRGYTLLATSLGLDAATSEPFDVVVGPPAQIAFLEEPGDGTGGTPLSQQPRVAVMDAGGNFVTDTWGTVSLTIEGQPKDARLLGRTTSEPLAGVAYFGDIGIDRIGNDYRLLAQFGILPSVLSAAFDVRVGPVAALEKISGDDQSGTAGSALDEEFVVRAVDAGGNPVSAESVFFELEAPPTSVGQDLRDTSATTGPEGQAATLLALGDREGSYFVHASVADTSVAAVAFSAWSIGPDGTGIADVTPEIAYISSETEVSILVRGDGRTTNRSFTVEIPWEWDWSGSIQHVSLHGPATGAQTAFEVVGDGSEEVPYVIEVENVVMTPADDVTVTLQSIWPPSDEGVWPFVVATAADGGALAPIESSPTVEVRDILIGDANLDGAVDVLDVLWSVDFILAKRELKAPQLIATDVYPDHAAPDDSAAADGRVELKDLELLQDAILDRAWGDGLDLGTAQSGSFYEPVVRDSAAYRGLVKLTFERYSDFVAVRLDNAMAVRGLQINLGMAGTSGPVDIRTFERSRLMDSPSAIGPAVVGGLGQQRRLLLFGLEDEQIEPGEGHILRLGIAPAFFEETGVTALAGSVDGEPIAVEIEWIDGVDIPGWYALDQNFSNPFYDSTTIGFRNPDFERVRIDVFDVAGRRVAVLLDEEMDPGFHILKWDGRDRAGREVGAGVYFYRMRARGFQDSKRMVVMKRSR